MNNINNIKENKELTKSSIDYWLLIATLAIVLFGSILVYTASFYNLGVVDKLDYSKYFFITLVYFIFGLFALVFAVLFNYKWYSKLNVLIYVSTLFLLIYVLVAGITINGATRWIKVASSFTVMPSEIAKAAIILMGSSALYKYKSIMNNKRTWVAIVTALFMLLILLILFERDLSTPIAIVGVLFIMMFVANVDFKYLISMFILGVFGVFGALMIESYRGGRISTWLDFLLNSNQETKYIYVDAKNQILNSVYAISSGGLFGKGLGVSDYKANRLPESQTDFIFSIGAEELGFVGSLILLAVFLFIIYRIFNVAMNCDDELGFYITSGVGILISVQVLINIGVVLALLPVTGMPLPFVSKGGTSLVVMIFLIGVVLNVSKSNKKRRVK